LLNAERGKASGLSHVTANLCRSLNRRQGDPAGFSTRETAEPTLRNPIMCKAKQTEGKPMTRIIPTLAIAGIAAIALAGTSIAQTASPTNPPTSTNSPNAQRSDSPTSQTPGSTNTQRSDSPNSQMPGSPNAQRSATPSVAAQPYGLRSVDSRMLGDGHRSSKFVGSTVVNEDNDTIGTVDDLIVMSNDKAPYAVISVGGFLGMGARYVVVPYSALQVSDKQVVLRGATKDSLKALDEYKYPI